MKANGVNRILRNAKIALSVKHLSNFLRLLEMPLIWSLNGWIIVLSAIGAQINRSFVLIYSNRGNNTKKGQSLKDITYLKVLSKHRNQQK